MKICGMVLRFFYILVAVNLLNNPLLGQKAPSNGKRVLILPVITRSIETGWSFGTAGIFTFRLSGTDTVSRTSNVELLVLYSTKKQLVTAINGTQYFDREKFILNEQFSFSSFPDKFWGLGRYAKDSAEEPYKFNQYYVYLHLLRKIAPRFFMGLLYERQKVWNISYRPGGVFDQQQIVGRHGYIISGLGSSFTYDSRKNAFSPDRGFFGQLYINHFDKCWSSDFNYTNIVVDLRKYIPLTRTQVLALQLYSFNNIGKEVPLRSLASFGGANRMRGYYDGRYKDQEQLVLQGEYRFPVYRRLGAVAFAGAGDVSSHFSEYSTASLKYSFGGGLRFALDKKEKLNLRLDYGIGEGKNRGFYLQLGEAF